ncbi:hypothetical protein EA147_05870 [Providencia stuartii]|nr:hypothetical protein EA147_05870 [Providencia stuartii]
MHRIKQPRANVVPIKINNTDTSVIAVGARRVTAVFIATPIQVNCRNSTTPKAGDKYCNDA